jgi:heme A synthase
MSIIRRAVFILAAEGIGNWMRSKSLDCYSTWWSRLAFAFVCVDLAIGIINVAAAENIELLLRWHALKHEALPWSVVICSSFRIF